MNIGISLFSGRQPIDTAVVAQKAEALGFDSLCGGTPGHTRAQQFICSWSSGAASHFYSGSWTPLWPWPGPLQ